MRHRVPDPHPWRKGGFPNVSKTRHSNVRLVYHRDFKGAEGSVQCIDCKHVYRDEPHCPQCGKPTVS
jgi:primosomal protein N'